MLGPDGGPGVPADTRARADGRTWAAVGVALLLLAAWLLGQHGRYGFAAGASAASEAAGKARTAPPAAAGRPSHPYAAHAALPAADPVRLDIPSLGIHAPVVRRGLTDGTIDPPPYSMPGVTGWYAGGPAPGAAGAALIVGHVDTETGPAVFLRLGDARPHAEVDVTRADRSVAVFTVEAVEVVPKAHFDAARVYGSATPGRPELRLITCGGTFDPAAHAYTANLVVYAALTSSHPAA